MSVGKAKGINTHGHLGWVTVKCRICAAKLDVTKRLVYRCPQCYVDPVRAYFCEADARRLRYKCPFCGKKLETLFEAGA